MDTIINKPAVTGNDESSGKLLSETTQELKPGAYLRNQTYRIVKVLGVGGYGITYLALDISLERYVAIKEFFPKDYCDRDFMTSHVTLGTQNTSEFVNRLKSKFLKEARNIAKLDHPGIIKIHAAFEENNTAYYVMDYVEGRNLYETVVNDGPLDTDKALEYINKVGKTLEYVHGFRMNHLDVKPANIIIRKSDDSPILIDFGLSKQYDHHGLQTSTTPSGLSHGFAPLEQYNDGGITEFSPQTDLYSLAATLYYLLSGEIPEQAIMLIEEELTFPYAIPAKLIGPISKAMSPVRKNRHKRIREFLKEIESARVTSMAASFDTQIDNKKQQSEKHLQSNSTLERQAETIINNKNVGSKKKAKKPRINKIIWFTIADIILAALCVIGYCNRKHRAEPDNPVASSLSVSELSPESPMGKAIFTGEIISDTLPNADINMTPHGKRSAEIIENESPDKTPHNNQSGKSSPETSKSSNQEKNGKLMFEYGYWEGGIKDGKPHGNGKLLFRSTHIIDRSTNYIGNPGEYLMATYENGCLISGKLYDSEGTLLKTIIP